MRAIKSLFALTLFANPLVNGMGQGVEPLGEQLKGIDKYFSDATFEVLLPSAQDPVVYDITLESVKPNIADTLAACYYLIRWEATSPSGPVDGFSSYFSGNHYRYRANRLQEYHLSDYAEPFSPSGLGKEGGVQNQAQFVDLLPQYIGEKLLKMATDSDYVFIFHPDTIVNGRRAIAIDGVKRHMGYDAEIFLYAFDYVTGLPLYIDMTTSPGSISEQIYTVVYKKPARLQPIDGLTEENLIEQWPEVFEKYRENNFRVENLVDKPLPDFSCQIYGSGNGSTSSSNERLAHARGEKFTQPTIIVALDPQVASTQSTIKAIREATAQLPENASIIWAINSNHSADIEDVIGTLEYDETALSSVGSLIRNCGITVYPTIIIVDKEGKVAEVVSGFNNDLTSIVIQKISLL